MSYLLKRNGYYYFRVRVPTDLVHIFHASEIKKSLKTESLSQAKVLSARVALAMEVIITVARIKLLGDDDARRLVSTYLHSTLQKRENMRAEGITIPKDSEDLDRLCREARDEMLQLRTDLIYNRIEKLLIRRIVR